MKDKVSAILTAAGNGTRIGKHKILMPINGKAVLWHTLSRFTQSKCIDEIVVVAKEEDQVAFEEVAKALKVVIKIVIGGKERIESLLNGINASTGSIIITHDGCRPFTPVSLIDKVISKTIQYGAVMTAVNPIATVKVGSKGFIEYTLPRRETWIAQTPQGFERSLILNSIEAAVTAQYFTPTDDSELVARFSKKKIYIVPGDDINIKITYPKDIYIAEKILEVNT